MFPSFPISNDNLDTLSLSGKWLCCSRKFSVAHVFQCSLRPRQPPPHCLWVSHSLCPKVGADPFFKTSQHIQAQVVTLNITFFLYSLRCDQKEAYTKITLPLATIHPYPVCYRPLFCSATREKLSTQYPFSPFVIEKQFYSRW